MRRHFSDLREDEVRMIWSSCVSAAIECAKNVNMGGLSQGGSHDIYVALESALYGEWERAKKARLNPIDISDVK